MSATIFTMAELAVLSTMLVGLIRKRHHAQPLALTTDTPPAG